MPAASLTSTVGWLWKFCLKNCCGIGFVDTIVDGFATFIERSFSTLAEVLVAIKPSILMSMEGVR
jgi:hypothetical protein